MTTTSTTNATGSNLVAAFEAVWLEAQQRHEDLPSAVFITGAGRERGGIVLGHWKPEGWRELAATPGTSSIPEVFVGGEGLTRGPVAVLTTILHEATHGIAHARGIKDTSRGNRYHNRRFTSLAADAFGLVAPERPHASIGWSDVTMPEGGEADWSTFPMLAEAITVAIGGQLGEAAPTAPTKRQPAYACSCRKVRLSQAALPALCGLCGDEFLEVVA